MEQATRARYISVADLAQMLGISRIAVFKKVKQGIIPAMKVGRSYQIATADIPTIVGRTLSKTERGELNVAVRRVVREYGETLKLLGRE